MVLTNQYRTRPDGMLYDTSPGDSWSRNHRRSWAKDSGPAASLPWATRARAADGWGDWELNRRAADAEAADGLSWLQAAMTALPQDLRDTAALTMGEEMTHAEAADVLGVSEGTVSWRLSEIRKRLKEMHEREMK